MTAKNRLLVASTGLFAMGVTQAQGSWEIVRNKDQMTGAESVSAYVESTNAVRFNLLGKGKGAGYTPRMWLECVSDKVRVGFDYGLHRYTKGSSVNASWRLNDDTVRKEKTWHVTRDRYFISPTSIGSALLESISRSSGNVSFQIDFLGNMSNSVGDPGATFATFPIGSTSAVLQEVEEACLANRHVPEGAETLAAKVQDGINFASVVQAAVVDEYGRRGSFPGNIFFNGFEGSVAGGPYETEVKGTGVTVKGAGAYLSEVKVFIKIGGVVAIAYNRSQLGMEGLPRSSTVRLTPTTSDNGISWTCEALAPLTKYQPWLPASCGGSVAVSEAKVIVPSASSSLGPYQDPLLPVEGQRERSAQTQRQRRR